MSASETGLRKSSQNTLSPSAFQNKLSKHRQSYNIVTRHQTKHIEIKQNLKHHTNYHNLTTNWLVLKLLIQSLNPLQFLRMVKYCINSYKRMHKKIHNCVELERIVFILLNFLYTIEKQNCLVLYNTYNLCYNIVIVL